MYNSCSKCSLSLPINYLTPIMMRNKQGQQKKGYLCNSCKSSIEAERTPNKNIVPPKNDVIKEGF